MQVVSFWRTRAIDSTQNILDNQAEYGWQHPMPITPYDPLEATGYTVADGIFIYDPDRVTVGPPLTRDNMIVVRSASKPSIGPLD